MGERGDTVPLVRHALEPSGPGGDDGELSGDEEAVDEDKRDHEKEAQGDG
jgi:hypothetical protein